MGSVSRWTIFRTLWFPFFPLWYHCHGRTLCGSERQHERDCKVAQESLFLALKLSFNNPASQSSLHVDASRLRGLGFTHISVHSPLNGRKQRGYMRSMQDGQSISKCSTSTFPTPRSTPGDWLQCVYQGYHVQTMVHSGSHR